MSQDTQRDQISKKRVVYTMPGMEAVPVRRDEPYRVTDAGPLTMDLYYPPHSNAGARTPAVIFVTGFSDLGAEKMLGSRFKDMGSFVSWAQLVAVSGLVGITYTNREPGDFCGRLTRCDGPLETLQTQAQTPILFPSIPNNAAFC